MSAVSGSNTINFSYNEDGSRASKTVNGTRHNYTWDGTTLVRDYYGNTILDFSYDANGQPYAMFYNSTPYFYILNLQGDVIRMVDGNGNTVASYEYDPYGRVVSATGSMANINPLRYRGYYYDQETKLYHLWSRYYDPQTGRFISADSYASTGQSMLGYNMFAYCNNDPINYGDHLGSLPTRKNMVFINDGAGGDIGPIGITNSHDAVRWNNRTKTSPVKEIIQSIDDFKASESGEAILAANQIRAGGSKIKNGFELILAPAPTTADDLLGVGLITYGVLQAAGGITKAIIWMVGK